VKQDITANRQSPVRVRVLLFVHVKKNIQFRSGPTWAISDEVLNICMNGRNCSVDFESLEPVVVPDFHVEHDFVIPETGGVVWVTDMRRTVFRESYLIAKEMVKESI
jgi:hypothetical protein